jgi:threonine/homoserine/homoserine lactone efflux protein
MGSGTQISVAITTMLTLIAYRFAIDLDLPKVSYLTRLDFFILISTILVYASLIEVIVTSTFAKSERLSQARAIDRWMRWLFPVTFIAVAVKTLVL